MQSNIKINPSGILKISIRESSKLIFETTVSNNIMPGAYEILSKRILNIESAKIDNMMAEAANNIKLADVPIINFEHKVVSSENQAVFTALFDENSFTGTVENLYLQCLGLSLDFAKVDSLAINKTNLQTITIEWTITIK